jgi:hypothetical protein
MSADPPLLALRQGVSMSRYRTETLRQLGWQPCKTQMVVEWCGHAQEYVPWPEADGYWRMVPVLG